jgi:hypothetical protein
MTPVSPASSDGSQLPPRHRPTLGELSKDTTESDLWDLEDDLVMPDDPPPLRPDVIRGPKELPVPREKRKTGGEEGAEAPAAIPAPAAEKIRLNVGKVRQSERAQGGGSPSTTPEREFEELDNWEDTPVTPDIGELHDPTPAVVEMEPMPVDNEAPSTTEIAAEERSGNSDPDDEFSPVAPVGASPVSLKPHLGLSGVERAGLIALAVTLVIIAATAYVFSFNRLPREKDRARETDFPIKGALVAVKSATTYWRPPITDGASPDTFRRGTELLPVIDVDLQGGPAAVRVLFRNEERVVVGDAVTRQVQTDVRLSIPATAGFDDVGMHAAYRTGESKPWTVEVYEAPTEDAPGRDFKKVFEMNISTDLR